MKSVEGPVCIRFRRRADGTVLTSDCPVGLAALKRKIALAGAAVAAFLSLAVGTFFGLRDAATKPPIRTIKAIDRDDDCHIMGKMAVRR